MFIQITTNYKILITGIFIALILFACEEEEPKINSSTTVFITTNTVELGAQSNGQNGSFYSTVDNKIYLLDEAFNNQAYVDLLYYFEAGDENVIASPGANISEGIFSGDNGLTNWDTLNETRFSKAEMSRTEFDELNDTTALKSLFDLDNNNRKAKSLQRDDVYAFRNHNRKFGAFKVEYVSGDSTGYIILEVKMLK